MEHVIYDDEGQLLSATFMDYAMPALQATCRPLKIGLYLHARHRAIRSAVKGGSETGNHRAARCDWQTRSSMHCGILGVRRIELPFTPHSVWQALRVAGAGE